MTIRKLYGAGFGPYEYDDTDTIDDVDSEWTGLLEHASVTDGGHLCAFLDLFDTNESNHLKIYWNENDTSNRTLAILVAGGNRSLTFNENFVIADGFDVSIQALGQANQLTLNEAFIIGDGSAGTLTFSAAVVLTVENTSLINQDLTTDSTVAAFANLKLTSVVNAATDTDKFLVLDGSNNIDFRTGAELAADIGAGAHTHDGDTLQHDGVNSNGGDFTITTSGNLFLKPTSKLTVGPVVTPGGAFDATVTIRRNDFNYHSNTIGFVLAFDRINSDIGALFFGADTDDNAVIATNNSNIRIGKQLIDIFYEYLTITVGIGANPAASIVSISDRFVNINGPFISNYTGVSFSSKEAFVIQGPFDHSPPNDAGIVFALDGYSSTYRKGYFAYEAYDGWNRGSMHFCLHPSANAGNATLSDAVLSLKYDGTVTIPGTMHIGGASNYLAVSAAGLLTFVGNSGLPFGGAHGDHIGWSVAASQNVWYNIVDADMEDGELRGVTHDGNGKLTVTEPGMWMVQYNMTIFTSVANEHVETGIEISGSGSADAHGIDHIETKFVNQEAHMSGMAILDLANNATLEIAIRTTDTDPGPTISVDDLHMIAVLIGGT